MHEEIKADIKNKHLNNHRLDLAHTIFRSIGR